MYRFLTVAAASLYGGNSFAQSRQFREINTKQMKKIFFLLCFVATSVFMSAQTKNETSNPIIGTWKFSNQSAINDFQKVFVNKGNYQTEHFIFEPNHTFRHEFIDKEGNLVKMLKGKWKFIGSQIKIEYTDIDFTLTINYFYIDKDLVLGQNFNHVIFTREDIDFQAVSSK